MLINDAADHVVDLVQVYQLITDVVCAAAAASAAAATLSFSRGVSLVAVRCGGGG